MLITLSKYLFKDFFLLDSHWKPYLACFEAEGWVKKIQPTVQQVKFYNSALKTKRVSPLKRSESGISLLKNELRKLK